MQKEEYPKKKRPREWKISRGLINLERKKKWDSSFVDKNRKE